MYVSIVFCSHLSAMFKSDRVKSSVKDIHTAEQLNIAALQAQLETRLFGRHERMIYFPTVDSTNTQAMRLALDGAEEGVVVVTDYQIAGRGRQGRQWVDVAGCNSITSLILRPLFAPYLLVMLAALAVVDAIAEVCNLTATIKWPNDVLITERKVAGILIETSRDRTGHMVAVMGIGVNVNAHPATSIQEPSVHDTLLARATSLEAEYGHKVSRERFIASLLRLLETSHLALQEEARQQTAAAYFGGTVPGARKIRERWRAHLSTLGRSIQIQQGEKLFSGVAEDVDEDGELLLRLQSGKQISITWGEIEYPTT
jgi:BirA family biotin operon repressor/biotin-[acetyl-CoA-carboxylase] ligase